MMNYNTLNYIKILLLSFLLVISSTTSAYEKERVDIFKDLPQKQKSETQKQPKKPPSIWVNTSDVYKLNNINTANNAMPTVLPPEINYCCFFDAIKYGHTLFWFRLRNEDVRQSGKKTAYANTIATHLGYRTEAFYDFSGLLEFTNTTIIGHQNFNSGGGTSDNLRRFATINDPTGTRVDQAFLEYNGIPCTDIKLGRQRIKIDNERFIGNAGWRQTEQTYDGISIYNILIPNVSLFYSYIDQVNRIWGPRGERPFSVNTEDTHLLNARYDFQLCCNTYNNLIAYGYLIRNADIPDFSTRTEGLRFNGITKLQCLDLLYSLEYAHQNNTGNNPVHYSTFYTHFAGGVGFKTLLGDAELDLQREELGGSTTKTGAAFKTPLASFHFFQGWAELFIVTPNQGIIDTYANASIKLTQLCDIKLFATYHNFRQSAGTGTYGNEIDFEISKDLNKYITFAITYANFGSKSKEFPHTEKLWVTLRSNPYV